MTFVVEDGTGKTDANSYASVAMADDYFADRGISDWCGTTVEKQQYLVRATDYIETRFGRKFRGAPEFPTQALSFPRIGIYGVVGIPPKLIAATCEYALRASSAPLAPDSTVDSSIVSVKNEVGPIVEEIVYSEKSRAKFKSYPYADELLATLTLSGKTVYR